MSTKGKGKKPRNLPLILGPLPVDRINRALGMELKDGDVVLSQAAQDHAYKRHQDEYDIIFPHVASIVTNPLLVGDDFNNPGRIEMYGRIATMDDYIMVAVSVETNDSGTYEVCSFFSSKPSKVQRRKEKGFLKPAL